MQTNADANLVSERISEKIRTRFYDNQAHQAVRSPTILQRIARADKTAFEDCVNFYGDFVWSLARKFTKTREDAEDAVQEIFIDIWKNSARFDPAKSPESAFIWLIARRRLIDQLRKYIRLPQNSFPENALVKLASDSHKKLQLYVEMRPTVYALNKLKPREKEIIQMAIYEGMSHSEIAKAVGLPLGTVKSRMRQGLKKIRSSIKLLEQKRIYTDKLSSEA